MAIVAVIAALMLGISLDLSNWQVFGMVLIAWACSSED